MKLLRDGYIHGERPVAKRLGTTRGIIRWLIKTKRIKPIVIPSGRDGLHVFSQRDQIIIKCWTNRKKAK